MSASVVRATLLAIVAAVLAGCWDEPVKETVTVDLRQPRRVGLAVVVELESARELQDDPGGRRAVEQAATLLFDGRHPWNDRFAALDCESESGGWQKRERELRRYELAAECSDPQSLARLLSDRQLVAELAWEPGGGELRLVPNGGGLATRSDRQRLERQLDGFARAVVRYVDAAREVARRAAAEHERAAPLWKAVLVETDSEAVPGLTKAEKAAVDRLLEAIGDLLAAFSRQGGEPESLDALARRVADPLPMRLELVPPAKAELEVDGFVAADGGRFALPPRGIEGSLSELEGRWFEPDPALTLLRQLRSGSDDPPDPAPFERGSILRSEEPVDLPTLRAEIEAALAPPVELRLKWRREPTRGSGAESEEQR